MAYLLDYMDLPSLAEDIAHYTQIGKKGKSWGNEFVQLAQPIANVPDTPTAPAGALAIAGKTKIPSYKCPSALNTELTSWGLATASYAGNYSIGQAWGFFSLEGRITRMGDITDGLSYTIAVSEAGANNGPVAVSYGATAQNQPAWLGTIHGNWNAQARHIEWYRGRGVPNGTRSDSFTSGHPGGVHALAGDGAVKWVSNSVDPVVFISLGAIRRRTGQTLSIDLNYDYVRNTVGNVWKTLPTTVMGTGPWDEIQAEWPE